jgi:hypothetical protein
MNADDLARRIVVRHREAGYLRLELPAEVCHPTAAMAFDAALRHVAGVYRVTFHAAQRRLVVSFDAHVCTAADVARALKACLCALPERLRRAAIPSSCRQVRQRHGRARDAGTAGCRPPGPARFRAAAPRP